MRSRIRYGWLIVLFLAAACLSPTAALASNKGIEVPCRVEPNQISVAVTPDSIDYGVLALSATEDTTAGGLNIVMTATNGDTTAKFQIKSSDAGGTTPWMLEATVGANQYTHKFSTDGGTGWTPMIDPDTYVELVASVGPFGTQDFDLQITMPDSADDLGAHTITVTIQAVTP